ncbi:MAG: DUF362 domain-containing protein [Actinobacteria bacterium]|nr:DUF362 domain-containing protein [Actinomycetota bacterium]
MVSDVYFSDMRTKSGLSLIDKVAGLFKVANFDSLIKKGDFVALKLHIGEPGNLAFLPPPIIRKVVELVNECGGKPFITDANTLYAGLRGNAIDHITSAYLNGFTMETVGAPFIVADGLSGRDHQVVKLDGIRLKEAYIGSAIVEADVLISLAHVKLHGAVGMGGAFKNVGMGAASRAGKRVQHAEFKPVVIQDSCTGCKRCIRWCPANAISINSDRKAYINSELCIGCAECLISCNFKAIESRWSDGEEGSLHERIAEYTKAVLSTKMGRSGFINFLINISPDCDCCNFNDAPIVGNIGFLASTDPVAIDWASADLINAAEPLANSRASDFMGATDKVEALTGSDWQITFIHAEKLGIGTRKYNLVKIK